VLLDWTKLLGLAQQEKNFVRWYAMLREIAAGESDMELLRHEFEQDWMGMCVSDWCKLDDVSAWWLTTESPAAQLLTKLDKQTSNMRSMAGKESLPSWGATQAQAACAGRWSGRFAAVPDHLGIAAETGAWSYHAAHPMLGSPYSTALARLLARLIDMAELFSGAGKCRLDAASPADYEGVSVVHTARGLLMHHVLLEDERVKDYVIVAPTEWNFHPDGALVRDLMGLEEHDAERLKHIAHIMALSLDPCVGYEVEVRHA
jgi:hypothetical protein